MRLLLVDDDEGVRCMLVNQMAAAGHIIDEAADGYDALAKINTDIYDAVICDWEMPKLSGPALCRAVRAGPRGRGLYFIMLTSRDTDVEQAEGYDAGADTFLTKPWEMTDLLAVLRTAQSMSKLPALKAS